MSSVPCIVIGGTHSGVGKTSIATALMSAFVRRGLTVQAFKVGPDFIDPTFHCVATGRASHNLDGWMLSRDVNLSLYARASAGADLAVVEGVMGLFDGHSSIDEVGSTAEMAKWLGAPVLLIADGSAMARSGAALVHGFESFDPELQVGGIIFNRVSGDKHFSYLCGSVQARCHSTPIGYLPSEPAVKLPERHLGLRLAGEVVSRELLDLLAQWVERTVDLDNILAIARTAKSVRAGFHSTVQLPICRRARIGVAKDPAFQFYYEENFRYLQEAGAELLEFSLVNDSHLPDGIDGLYLGGGYPEVHAAALAANKSMQDNVRSFAERGGPIYAECGGFMYLTEAIVDSTGQEHAMCGIFPTRARMQSRLAGLGYAEIEPLQDIAWLRPNEPMRGHEFRYSTIDEMPASIRRVYRAHGNHGTKVDGYLTRSVLGSYFHVHFGSCPAFAKRFVAAASASREPAATIGSEFSI